MTFQDASRGAAVPPAPNPDCPRCKGSGAYPDPPLAVQEREASEGKRRWVARKPCDCFADPQGHYPLVIDGRPVNL